MYDRVADLSLRVESVALTRHERDTTSGFTRVSTELALQGDGVTGRGEDVSYDAPDHDRFPAPADLDLAGEYTLRSFSSHLEDLDAAGRLWPTAPERPASRHYRRWAFESAALDLALRQAGTDLGAALGRSYDPLSFVVSRRLGDPEAGEAPSVAPLQALRERNPDLGFKLDPVPEWDGALFDDLAGMGNVRVLDLKGLYEDTEVDVPADPDLYRQVIETFPDAVIEDPQLTAETEPLFDGHQDRVSWDFPITSVADLAALPWEPAWLNCKPSRFGTVESLFAFIEYCADRGIRLYGGGQFELGVGRDQIQALASLCYPDGPNDVAPMGYNEPEPPAGLPGSPLDVSAPSAGFGWD